MQTTRGPTFLGSGLDEAVDIETQGTLRNTSLDLAEQHVPAQSTNQSK